MITETVSALELRFSLRAENLTFTQESSYDMAIIPDCRIIGGRHTHTHTHTGGREKGGDYKQIKTGGPHQTHKPLSRDLWRVCVCVGGKISI